MIVLCWVRALNHMCCVQIRQWNKKNKKIYVKMQNAVVESVDVTRVTLADLQVMTRFVCQTWLSYWAFLSKCDIGRFWDGPHIPRSFRHKSWGPRHHKNILEHTQNTFTHFAFAHLHIICDLAGKKCVNLHKLCVIYTFLGQQEALVDHGRKSQTTFTWHRPRICLHL
jgi:hypothetical protein